MKLMQLNDHPKVGP